MNHTNQATSTASTCGTNNDSQPPLSSQHRFGYVALIGAPNVGKSTLLNGLVGHPVSVVSAKAHTTRQQLSGIACHHHTQLFLIDTPGLEMPNLSGSFSKIPPLLRSCMKRSLWRACNHAHFSLVILDGKAPFVPESLASFLQQEDVPFAFVINKIDTLNKPRLLSVAQDLQSQFPHVQKIFMVCGKKQKGLKDILGFLEKKMPLGPWPYPPESLTTLSERFLACDITRESLFHTLYHELPHTLHVETDLWAVKKKALSLHQVIYLAKESHKAIVVGKGARVVREVGQRSREKLQRVFPHYSAVHLMLHVKVEPSWPHIFLPSFASFV